MRLFVGLPASSPALEEAARELEAMGARTVAPRKMHVTLRFLGEVEDPSPVVAALGSALADAPAVQGVLRGAGGFPDLRREGPPHPGPVARPPGGQVARPRQAGQGQVRRERALLRLAKRLGRRAHALRHLPPPPR
ncbi:MAG TPA: 2'-5' RNA ligase family protein, partial [Candidatus Thermoplasmatota archaeon]|nr:2'-5' RNA ligase family protein [Candidatus Thermoplasmatota archaeon]